MKRSSTVLARAAGVILAALVMSSASAQKTVQPSDKPQTDPIDVRAPTSSHGGKAVMLPKQPVADADDPVNRLVAAETVDGLALSITIDGEKVNLNAIAPARIPRRLAKAERNVGSDSVKVTGMANGRVVAVTVVPDNVVNASEGEGLVRTERRQIAVVLAADQPIDTILVEASATNAKASLDTRAVYAKLCEADRESKWCTGNR